MKGKVVKWIVLVLTINLILIACTPEISQKPDIKKNLEKENRNVRIPESVDFEPDINHISIKSDIDLSTNLNEKGHIDYLINEKSYLQYSEKITNYFFGNIEPNRIFKSNIPPDINVSLMYKKYLMPYDYFLVTEENVPIHEAPSKNSNIVGYGKLFDKIKLINEVSGENIDKFNTNVWYGISFLNSNGKVVQGYIPFGTGKIRTFRFGEMYRHIQILENELIKNKYGYITNYKDMNGSPPLLNGKGYDNFGMQAYQSAPAYENLENTNIFRYIPDGMIVFILGEIKGFYKVKCISYEGEYWVPKQYISFDNNIDRLAKVVIVDITNQNQGAFEKRGSKWTLVSYTLATTGVKEKKKFETTQGYFKVMEIKDKLYYVNDITKEIAGYAPYGIRFTQGAYIHGIPVEFIIENDIKMDPGIREFLITVGTVPRSHKCVRNFTSHAKYLYSWVDLNETAIIVIK